MSGFELEETPAPASGFVKPGTHFCVRPGIYIYTGGLTPETSSLRISGDFEVVEQVKDSSSPAWWCRPVDSNVKGDVSSISRLQICLREEDILAYCKPT